MTLLLDSFEVPCAPQSERLPRQWAKKRGVNTRAWKGHSEHVLICAHHQRKEPLVPHAEFQQSEETERLRSLFIQFRSGVSLLPSEEMRALAKQAVAVSEVPVDVDEWAKRLADDTGSAHD